MLLRCREWACPRWAISKNPREIKDGHIPYGRISHDEVLRTVNTRTCEVSAGFSCLHPDQPRVLSVRELARAQVGDQADDRPGRMRCMLRNLHAYHEQSVNAFGKAVDDALAVMVFRDALRGVCGLVVPSRLLHCQFLEMAAQRHVCFIAC